VKIVKTGAWQRFLGTAR